MINIEIAKDIMQQLTIGQNVKYIIDGITYDRPLVEKLTYGFVVQGPTNKLTLPVELTAAYQEELEQMGRSPLPPDTTTRRRGRPSKGENVAPVNMPMPPAYLPPGSGYTGPVQQSPSQFPQASQEQPQRPQTTLAQDVARAETAVIPIQAAEGSDDWATEAMDEAISIFRDTVSTIVENLQKQIDDTPTAVAAEPHLKTCYDCVNVDMENNICGLFKVAPPMKVQCDAKTNCDKFFDCEEIPF